MQTIIVGIIILLSISYLAFKALKSLRSKNKQCGGGCGCSKG